MRVDTAHRSAFESFAIVAAENPQPSERFLLPEGSHETPAQMLQALLDASDDHIYVFDSEGRILYAPAIGAKTLGMTPQEMLGKTLREMGVDDALAQRLDREREQVFATGTALSNTACFSDTGDGHWYEYTWTPLRDTDGGIRMVMHVSRDVTERVRSEQAMRDAQHRYQTLANAPIVGFTVGNTLGQVIEANQTFLDMVGYTQAELEAGQVRWDRLTPPEYAELDRQKQQEVIEQGFCVMEKEYMHKDGHRIPVLLGRALLTKEPLTAIGFVVDLTERKQAEERLRFALDAAHMVAWDWDVATGQVSRFGDLLGVLGMMPHESPSAVSQLLTFIHPDDRAGFVSACQAALNDNKEYSAEYRVVRPDEQIRWIADCGRVKRDSYGKAVRFSGVLRDITEQKNAQDALRKSEQEARRLTALIEGTTDFVAISNPQGQIIYLNEAGRQMLGLSPEVEPSAFHHSDLCPAWVYERTQQEWLPLALREGTVSDEGALLTVEGREIPVSFVLQVHRGSDGESEAFSTTARDITERKQAEALLRESEEQARQQAELLETLLDHIPTGITIADAPDIRVRKSNRFGEQISGVRSAEIEGRAQSEVLWNVLHRDGSPAREEELPLTRATLQGEVVRGEEWMLAHPVTGEKIVLLCNAAPVRNAAGDVQHGILVWSDITEQKRVEAQLRESEERQHRATYESSHRIKNQLQVLAATIDMVLVDEQQTVSVEELHRLRSQITAIAATHDLLTQATKVEGTADHIPAHELLERTLTALQQTTRRHRIRHTLTQLSLPVKTATSLALIINEAVSNGIKHGGSEVEVRLSANEDEISLEVRDDGHGFHSGFDARRAANTGLELILALTATDLNGTVTFANHPEGGAWVKIIFPLPPLV